MECGVGRGVLAAEELFSNNLLIVPRGKFYNFNFELTMLLLFFFFFFFPILFLSVFCRRLYKARKALTLFCNEAGKIAH